MMHGQQNITFNRSVVVLLSLLISRNIFRLSSDVLANSFLNHVYIHFIIFSTAANPFGILTWFCYFIFFALWKLKLFDLKLSVVRFCADNPARTSSYQTAVNISHLANFIANDTQKCLLQEINNSVIKSGLALLKLVRFTFQLNTQHG
jgi:hypothetical protein